MQIEESIRRCVVFLYAGAADERRPVGTGFFVAQAVSGRSRDYLYLVTAKHIVEGVHLAGQRHYARVNVRGPLDLLLLDEAERESDRLMGAGETPDIKRLFEDLRANPPAPLVTEAEAAVRREPSLADASQFVDLGEADKWIFHEDFKVDMAALDWQPPALADVFPLKLSWAVTPEFIAKERIGPGEDVFVVGLFRRHTGQLRNIPIIRVGNLVAMPEEPVQTATGLQEAYLVELHSIGGLSGSPVFVYLGGVRRHFPFGGELTLTQYAGAIHLLGLVHGHWNVGVKEELDAAHDALDKDEHINMGIAIVVPIARLLEILDYPEVRDVREKAQ